MNQGHGILIFGFCFSIFLTWLWRYQDPGLQPETGSKTAAASLFTGATGPAELDKWLADNGLDGLQVFMETAGIKSLEDCATSCLPAMTSLVDSKTLAKLREVLPKLDLELWLRQWEAVDYLEVLVGMEYSSLTAVCSMSVAKADQIAEQLPVESKQNSFKKAVKSLQQEDLCVEDTHTAGWSIGGTVFYVVCILVVIAVVVIGVLAIGTIVAAAIANVIIAIIGAVFGIIFSAVIEVIFSAFTGRRVRLNPPQPIRVRPVPTLFEGVGIVFQDLFRGLSRSLSGLFGGGGRRRPPPRAPIPQQLEEKSSFSLGLYERIKGSYLDTEKCTVEWNHPNHSQVGSPSVLTIKLLCKNATPYLFKVSDSFKCRVAQVSGKVELPHVVEPTSLVDQSVVRVSFTAKVAGDYKISLKINTGSIGRGDITRTYIPGPIDSNKTVILDKTAVLVVTKGVYCAMKIIPKDSFGNKAVIEEKAVQIQIRKDSKTGPEIVHELVVYKNDFDLYELLIKLDAEGHYVGSVQYEGLRIGPPHFTIISLSEENMQTVEKNVKKKNLNVWYEAMDPDKGKKVYCYISPRQLQVREYFMKIIQTRAFTCKVTPSTQIIFHREPEHFTLDDGFQEPLTLVSPHREILGATFHKFVLRNIGGSEKFQDKQNFFYSKLREHHHRQNRSEKKVLVHRADLLESARRATKGFSPHDWCRKFCIVFKGEEGLDWGGLSREFFEQICVQLFDASNHLFMRFSDENHQALVHPNHASKRPSSLKPKHFNFAGKIVGKCLYESCCGNTLLVKARFTRSFLAQLIGLRINYRYFESDDPDLYTRKIQYILENDVSELCLVFEEEEFDSSGGSSKVVPLVENGGEKEVTEENKSQYLNALAQYRLTKRVSEEISQFLKGLNEIVPDSLLSIFNENELELLMCGMGTVNYDDLKEHAVVSGTSSWFQQVLSWFWIIVSSFTQEEMAKLLQFVTGCSQLPPGGFKELNPRFTITSAPTRNRLPTAHTCFNQLCLPEYSSSEQLESSLMTSIYECGEGFGLL